MTTTAELWPLRRFRAAKFPEDVESQEPYSFTVPEFQRSLVWPPRKQEALVQSLIRNYPVGAVLLVGLGPKDVTAADGSAIRTQNFAIIDGLQRINAIAQHLKYPLESVTEDVLEDAVLAEIVSALEDLFGGDVDSGAVGDAILEWIRQVKEPDPLRGYEHDSLLSTICEALGLVEPDRQGARTLKPSLLRLLKSIEKSVDISARQIPVLIYSGPRADLPEIFERINTQGTVLSKYEVFAAAWFDELVEVRDKEIKKAIRGRYKALTDEGFELQGERSPDTFSLFDYLYGLSQVLGLRFPRLFSRRDARRGKSSVAFPLATLVLGKPLSEMPSLPDFLPRKPNNTLDLGRLEAVILESAAAADHALANYLGIQLQNEGEALAHGELQMASVVAAFAAQSHDPWKGFKRRPGAAAGKKKLDHAVPQHYLYDILRQQWRGSLYTYAYERVWAQPGKPSQFYLSPITKDQMDSVLKTSFTEQLTAVSHKRKNVTAVDRAVLKFIYSGVITSGEQAKHKFDIEHLIPVDRIVKMTTGKEPWALGALGNLGILPSGPNRIKKSETISEYFGRTRRPPDAETKALVTKLALVPTADVAIPKVAGKDAMSPEDYLSFVSARWGKMSSLLLDRLGCV